MVKLINPRGRVVDVEQKEVPDLLKRGFLHVPADQPDMTYSQVHDRGVVAHGEGVREDRIVKRRVLKLGDTLSPEEI